MSAPASLVVRSGDGTEKVIVSEGTALPAQGKIVFATSRAGQDALEVELLEGGQRRIARARFELPRGLPANCWIPIEIRVGVDLRVRAEAQENLRRIRVDATFDTSEADETSFSV